jgi:hypothetical protein
METILVVLVVALAGLWVGTRGLKRIRSGPGAARCEVECAGCVGRRARKTGRLPNRV